LQLIVIVNNTIIVDFLNPTKKKWTSIKRREFFGLFVTVTTQEAKSVVSKTIRRYQHGEEKKQTNKGRTGAKRCTINKVMAPPMLESQKNTSSSSG
jgi:hypothetical protein